MAGEVIRDGGCACGAVRYQVRGEPIMVHNCYCRICQRETGGPCAVHGAWEAWRVAIRSGALAEAHLQGGSGRTHIWRRCRDCGVALFGQWARFGALMMAIRAGTLDEPGSIRPDVAIFVSSKPAWVSLPEGIPAFAEFYDFAAVLPPASLARLAALAARRAAGEGEGEGER